MNRKSMSTTQEIISGQIASGVAKAANADELGERQADAVTQTASGWDSYEVWRRFIKEARDRREAAKHPRV